MLRVGTILVKPETYRSHKQEMKIVGIGEFKGCYSVYKKGSGRYTYEYHVIDDALAMRYISIKRDKWTNLVERMIDA